MGEGSRVLVEFSMLPAPARPAMSLAPNTSQTLNDRLTIGSSGLIYCSGSRVDELPPQEGPSSRTPPGFTARQATYRAQNNLPETKGPLMCFIGRRFGEFGELGSSGSLGSLGRLGPLQFLLASFRLDAQKGYDLLLEALVEILEAPIFSRPTLLIGTCQRPPKPQVPWANSTNALSDRYFSFPDFVSPAHPKTPV